MQGKKGLPEYGWRQITAFSEMTHLSDLLQFPTLLLQHENEAFDKNQMWRVNVGENVVCVD